MIDYDRLAADYAAHRTVHPKVLKELLSVGAPRRDSRVLEVGCGTGNYLRALFEATQCEAHGVDPSAEMLQQARRTAPHIDWRQGRAEHLDFPSESLDMVFSVDVIHHVRDRREHFSEVARVLAPGGKTCTVTDSEWIIRNRVPLASYFPETVEPELRRYPRTEELVGLMRAAGLVEPAEKTVEFDYKITSVEPYRRRVFSSLMQISPEAFDRGLKRMESDLAGGPIQAVSRYVLLWGTQPGRHLPGGGLEARGSSHSRVDAARMYRRANPFSP